MKKNSLIIASIGLVKDGAGHYFMQIISADEQNHYFVPTTATNASIIAEADHIEIAHWKDCISYTSHHIIAETPKPPTEAQEWWNKLSHSGKQVASSLYNFTGEKSVEEIYEKYILSLKVK